MSYLRRVDANALVRLRAMLDQPASHHAQEVAR